MDRVEYRVLIGNVRASVAKWSELNAAYEAVRTHKEDKSVLASVEENPVTPESIALVRQNGWRVEADQELLLGGVVFMDQRRIIIAGSSHNYQRDQFFFHELMHAHYPLVDDSYGLGVHEPIAANENNIIAEWLGRTHRANPDILKAAVTTFNLPPYVYDRPSMEAFGKAVKLPRAAIGTPLYHAFIAHIQGKVCMD